MDFFSSIQTHMVNLKSTPFPKSFWRETWFFFAGLWRPKSSRKPLQTHHHAVRGMRNCFRNSKTFLNRFILTGGRPGVGLHHPAVLADSLHPGRRLRPRLSRQFFYQILIELTNWEGFCHRWPCPLGPCTDGRRSTGKSQSAVRPIRLRPHNPSRARRKSEWPLRCSAIFQFLRFCFLCLSTQTLYTLKSTHKITTQTHSILHFNVLLFGTCKPKHIKI